VAHPIIPAIQEVEIGKDIVKTNPGNEKLGVVVYTYHPRYV
jgi:hypothetical protein